MILLDTLRPDHLGFFGYRRETSPFLDGLARESAVFESAESGAAATFPAVNTLFTSRPGFDFYRTNSSDLGIPDRDTTLAEALAAAGWTTHAISASPVVRAAPSVFNPGGGFGQGFASFDESCAPADRHVEPFSTDCVVERARDWLSSAPTEPFFLYLHILDPHAPYQAPAAERSFADPEHGGPAHVVEGRTHPVTRRLENGAGPEVLAPEDLAHLVDLYDDEIRAVDRRLAALFESFRGAAWFSRALFAIVSDHGESFFEKPDAWQHGGTVYETETRMLLLLHGAGVGPPELRRDLACGVDVAPTLLERLGLPIPRDWEGRPLLAPGAEAGSDRTCESVARSDWTGRGPTRWAIRRGPLKILGAPGRPPRLFDVREDPGETRDLLGDAAERSRLPREVVVDLMARSKALGLRNEKLVEASVLDPGAREVLRALGYVD